MGTPSPMSRPKASQAYERLLRREIAASEYWQALSEEAREDALAVLNRRREDAPEPQQG